jgi:ATP-dependent helicase/nuclease subunit A
MRVRRRLHVPIHLQMRALTFEQEQAVARRRGPLLLAAGAGSGKTSVLVERFVRAVREDGIAPGRILAITFTERAAAELRARVRARLLELDEREAARDTEGAPIGTFHGFCARLLRIHALTAGLDPEFTILDETGAERLRLLAFRRALAELLAGERRAEAVDLLAAYNADRVRRMVLGVYAEQRSRGVTAPTLPSPTLPAQESPDPTELEAIRACELLGMALEELGRRYTQLKRERSALDFDDLELRARDLLAHHEGVRRSWAERIELLMVDEFQDTNPRQLALLELLERENLFTVGDELQSIYGFRHAEVEIFRERHHRLHAEGAAIALAHNFRGRPPLIAAVNSVFGERFGETYTPLIAAREQPDQQTLAETGIRATGECPPASVELLLTDKGAWSEGGSRTPPTQPLARAVAGGLPPATLWRQAEARLLAQRVAELVAAGQTAAGDVAVLLRAATDIPVYERALEEHGLRTLAAVGSFWGHQQVGDLLAWLRALANPLDELALYSVLASPLVGLSSDGLALVALATRAGGAGVWATIARGAEVLYEPLPAPDRERLKRFAERFDAERRAAPTLGAAELLLHALSLTDLRSVSYEQHVLSLTWGERRLANVHKLLRLARRFEAVEGRDLRGFLDHVEHRRALSASSEPHAPTGSEPDAVRLMTIHAAKGLEFPVVCLADLGRNGNGTPPDLLVDGGRIGLRLASLDGSPPVACLHYEELREERRRAEEAEEERIIYVAMTRARERLLLSGSCDFERWPAARSGGAPIVWLAPALVPELPELARTLERPVVELAAAGGATRVLCWLNSPATVGEVLREASPQPAKAAPGGSECAPAASPRLEASAPVPKPYPLSYTALSELERCGYRYYLERVLRMPENRVAGRGDGSGDGLRARARGLLVHKLLESFDFAHPQPPSPREVSAVARELGVATSPPEREEIAELVRSAAETELAQRLAAAERLRREHPFAFALSADEPLVNGVLDLLAIEPDGGWLVVDYKSDRVTQTEDLEALVEREYGAQRLLYALAALHAGAPRVEIVHWFLERPHEWVRARFHAAELPPLQERLRGRMERARERAFAVSESPHRGLCLTCPGRARLCSWDAADTLRERPPAESRGDR